MSSKEETYYGYEEHAGSLIASQHGQSSCPLLQTNPQPPRGPPRAPRPEEATPVSYWFLCQNQVLIVCMTQDQLFHTYDQNCSQITKYH
jgi:hypothetical protein